MRKAKVLAAGGFPEEVSPLHARSLGTVGAAKRGKVLAKMGADPEIRRLVDNDVLPRGGLVNSRRDTPGALLAAANGLEPLIVTTTRIPVGIKRKEPSLSARAISES